VSQPELRVVEDPASEVAALLAEAAAGGGNIVLTGGSTPERAYEQAADADWSAATVWLSDERCVPPDHQDSNFGMIEAALLSRVSIAPEVVRMQGELGPDAGAGAYEAEIRARLGGDPRWNLLLLGMGPDGHVASLFPGHPQLDVDDEIALGVTDSPKPPPERISLTFPALNRARSVWYLASGEGKAEAIARALGGAERHEIPATGVSGLEETIWFLDRSSSSAL